MCTDKQRVGEVTILILGVPPTNYMTLFKSLGQASLYFSFLICTLGECLLNYVETLAYEA